MEGKNIGISLSNKDKEFRNFTLNGNMWKVIFQVCMPLAIFQAVTYMFNTLDTMIASHISADAVSAVAYLTQLQSMVAAIGAGLSVGGAIKISQSYGAGNYEQVKKWLSTLLGICIVISIIVLAFLPFTSFVLRVTGTPEMFITMGTRYFNITLVATILSFFNNVYIAIERSRGNSKRIMYLNIGIITLKLSMTAWFVYVMKADITMIATATLLSQAVLCLIAIKNLSGKQDVFGFSRKYMDLKSTTVIPIISLSFPVIMEKIAFAFGKTIVNSMSKMYGDRTVGALGISNNICGSITAIQDGLKDGGASIISQNIGGNRLDRAIEAFWKILIINMIYGVFGYIILNVFMEQITFLFANSKEGLNREFQETIIRLCRYDTLGGCIPLGINAAVMALLFGFGYTKLTLSINFCRVFVFRIPVLWAFQNFTELGTESVGIVMMISNVLVGLMSAVIGFFVLKRIRKKMI